MNGYSCHGSSKNRETSVTNESLAFSTPREDAIMIRKSELSRGEGDKKRTRTKTRTMDQGLRILDFENLVEQDTELRLLEKKEQKREQEERRKRKDRVRASAKRRALKMTTDNNDQTPSKRPTGDFSTPAEKVELLKETFKTHADRRAKRTEQLYDTTKASLKTINAGMEKVNAGMEKVSCFVEDAGKLPCVLKCRVTVLWPWTWPCTV